MGDKALEYKVGDKVVAICERKPLDRVVHRTAKMEKEWVGKLLTISEVQYWHKSPYYKVEENDFLWDNSLLAQVGLEFCVSEDEDIADASFGKFFSGYAVKAE